MNRRDVERALKKKGFQKRETHHRYYRLVVDDKVTHVFTKVSTGKKHDDLGPDLVQLMAGQIRLKKREFERFVDCSISKSKYVEILRERGEI